MLEPPRFAVISIDIDPVKIKCARRNAQVYGVADKIQFVCANFMHVAESVRRLAPIDAVFLSPPWGGPAYRQSAVFDIATGCSPNGLHIYASARAITPNIVYLLPRHTDLRQLKHLAGECGNVEVEQAVFNKKLKLVSAYYGQLIRQ